MVLNGFSMVLISFSMVLNGFPMVWLVFQCFFNGLVSFSMVSIDLSMVSIAFSMVLLVFLRRGASREVSEGFVLRVEEKSSRKGGGGLQRIF